MITALVRVYNSAEYLQGCLDSVRGQMDHAVIGDGWFPFKYKPGGGSTDNTEEIARRFPNVHWIPSPPGGYSSEAEKNNRMLRDVAYGSWVLYIDPDQRLVGDVRTAVGQAEASGSDLIPVPIKDRMGNLLYCTLFKNWKGVRFEKHHTLRFEETPVLDLYLGGLPEGVYYEHVRPP